MMASHVVRTASELNKKGKKSHEIESLAEKLSELDMLVAKFFSFKF